MRIPLTKGFYAIVDARDAWVAEFKWHAHVHASKGLVYARRTPGPRHKQSTILLHRVITGAKPGELVDHKNRNGLDNRRSNLRICTHAQNVQNSRKRHNCTSRFKGVSWHKRERKWHAQIKIGTRNIHLGTFSKPEDAHAAYVKAARRLHGEFARVA